MVEENVQISAGKTRSVSTRFMDFWFLGGASLLLLLTMTIGNIFRESNPIVQQKFMLIGPTFGLFSILCNDPHFIISYKFGYTRGVSFLRKYWFSLIVVPVSMIILYSIAYFYYDMDISEFNLVIMLNRCLELIGLKYRIGETNCLGQELLGISIWTMYLTVGWHYAKQVYGCMMVYNNFDNYGLTLNQKKTIKLSLLSLAVFQFIQISRLMDNYNYKVGSFQDSRFPGVQIQSLELPNWLYTASGVVAAISFSAVALIFIYKFLIERKMPSIVFLTAWLSIYIWWVQFQEMPEFYYLTVPFFHSLQYLPFAYKMERGQLAMNKWLNLKIGLRVFILMVIGFLSFELIPWILDQKFDTETVKTAWFFSTSIVVFINIHHFFIDSAVWRLSQKEVKQGLILTENV